MGLQLGHEVCNCEFSRDNTSFHGRPSWTTRRTEPRLGAAPAPFRREALRSERGARFDAVVSVRNDALWLRELPPRATLAAAAGGADAVLVKACLSWGGLNDKFAVLPRAHAAAWMRLLEAYYDEVRGTRAGAS